MILRPRTAFLRFLRLELQLIPADEIQRNQRSRRFHYSASLLLTLVALICCFRGISRDTLIGDEAAFATSTLRMHETRDWLIPYIACQPHLNMLPLYSWLSLTVIPFTDDEPLRYRFWSCVFGIGLTLQTSLLGRRLFGTTTGFVAGLLLILNRDLLFEHGIRFGGMDAMLAFFVSAAFLLYERLDRENGASLGRWSLLGLSLGLACLSKPPAFGLFFGGVLVLHHLVAPSGRPLRVRLAGPTVAVLTGLLVTVPWYVAVSAQLGRDALHQLFIYNSVDRALDAANSDSWCCVNSVWHASNAFKLVPFALAFGIACMIAKRDRRAWHLNLLMSLPFLAALTYAGKSCNYIYFVFPVLSIAVARFLTDLIPACRSWLAQPDRIRPSVLAILFSCVFVGLDAEKIIRKGNRPPRIHPPLGLSRELHEELERGECRMIVYDFPTPERIRERGFQIENYCDLYFSIRLFGAVHVTDVNQLRKELTDHRPTVVLLPTPMHTQPELGDLVPELRIAENQWPSHAYPMLFYHGAAQLRSHSDWKRIAWGNQPP